jgi:hypothetical protein
MRTPRERQGEVMRSREEIIAEAFTLKDPHGTKTVLEVLLDIRDLLAEEPADRDYVQDPDDGDDGDDELDDDESEEFPPPVLAGRQPVSLLMEICTARGMDPRDRARREPRLEEGCEDGRRAQDADREVRRDRVAREEAMTVQAYKAVRFKPDSRARIALCNSIISGYQAQGLRLTLRQLYYQLVTRNAVTNEERSYQNLSKLVSDARLSGLMDWDAIEDRVRRPYSPNEFANLGELVDAALRSYRLPRWRDQANYVELWVEKDALAGVLQPLASEYHVTMMVNRGYSSQSAMYESAQRFLDACRAPESDDDPSAMVDDENEEECETCYGSGACQACDGNGTSDANGEKICKTCEGDADCKAIGCRRGYVRAFVKQPILFYLGDLDPSGEDMVRDIEERLKMFGVRGLHVTKLALTPAQVKQYQPPPNPAKMTDPRAEDYIAKHGTSSWEVDALPPQVLAQIIRAAFKSVHDPKKMSAIKKQEESDKTRLRDAAKAIMEKS